MGLGTTTVKYILFFFNFAFAIKHSYLHSVKELLKLNNFNDQINETEKNETEILKSAKRAKNIHKYDHNQPTLLEFTSVKKSCTSQDELDILVQNVIVNACLPFSIVDHFDFKTLIQKGFPGRTLMSRPTLMKRLNTQFQHHLIRLKEEMTSIKYLTTTADCWSIFKRSYIGITCHWIVDEDLTRKSCVLTVKRLEGKHTFDVLAKEMESVYIKYDINNKISYTTTDNGSNFVKSFKIFGKDNNIDNHSDTIPNVDEIEEETNAEIINITDIFNENVFSDDFNYSLPKHHRCAAHTLNLVATNDIENAVIKCDTGSETRHSDLLLFKKQRRQTIAKCTALWNKQNRSTTSGDIVKKYLGVYLKTPNETRWNSFFDSTKHLLLNFKKNPGIFLRMCDDLNVSRLNKSDTEWLDDYVFRMEPLAICLDILQGDKSMYFGFLIPSISQLISKYSNMKQSRCFVINGPLVDIIHNSLLRRFSSILTDPFLIIAAVSHPFFKTQWCDNTNKDSTITVFTDAVIEIHAKLSDDQNTIPSEDIKENCETSENDFFSWSNKSSLNVSIENEISTYLSKSPNKLLLSLNETPSIKKVFIKYNTPLPSSASV